MSNDSQESPSSRPRLYPSVLTPMQIERLKREDEEEHWISGEELYTEGSSDDEDDRLIGAAAVISDVENIRSNTSINEKQANRSKCLNPGDLRSARPTCGGSFRQKLKIDEPDCPSSTSVIHPTTIIPLDVAPDRKTSSSTEDESVKTDLASGETAENFEEEKEISWRPKRDDTNNVRNIIIEETIVDLKELQFEYKEMLDSLSDLKNSLTPSSGRSVNSRNLQCCDNYLNNESEIRRGVDVFAEAITAEKNASTADFIIGEIPFGDRDVDRWSNAMISTDEIKNEIIEMVKLDACIEEIYEKVKKSREETFKEQIANRRELKKLQTLRSPESGKLAKNSKHFFKLCGDNMEIESTEEIQRGKETGIYLPENESQEFERNIVSLNSESNEEVESRKSRREKLEEELSLIENRKANFIERNIELASRAMGTLAITDEEKNRLEKLVEDTEDSDDRISTSNSSYTDISTPYTIDKDADELLKNLTDQIENINSETYRKFDKDRCAIREEFLPHKERLVINSLRALAESNSKMIYPISEEEMRRLINEYHAEKEASMKTGFSDDLELGGSTDSRTEVSESKPASASTISESLRITQNAIKELVEEAKTTMPLFQFKNPSESIDKFEDEDEAE